jgi:hypothetical protein
MEEKQIAVQQPKTKKVKSFTPKESVKPIEVKEEILSDVEVARKMVNIHSSASSRNLEFNLTFDYVKKLLEYDKCYYTNVPFTEEGLSARSFDRLDNDKGYILGNVVACTVDINGKKNNLTIEEIICLYKKLAYLKK